jgi:hypothetical protein
MVLNYGWHNFPALSKSQSGLLLNKEIIDFKDGLFNRVRVGNIENGVLEITDNHWYSFRKNGHFNDSYMHSRLPTYKKILGVEPTTEANRAEFDLGSQGRVVVEFYSTKDRV